MRAFGPALTLAAAIGAGLYFGIAEGLWHALDGLAPWTWDGWHPTPGTLDLYLALPGYVRAAPLAVTARMLPAAVAAGAAAWGMFRLLFQARPALRHVSGPRVLTGQEAVAAAQRLSAKDGYTLHDALRLPRSALVRHLLIAGSVGAGKTQIILRLLRSLRRRRVRCLILDTKGDYTSHFTRAVILNPWDARSACWDIAADVRTVSEAQAFAAAVVPQAAKAGSDKHWETTAQGIITGAVVVLQERRQPWGWQQLAWLLHGGLSMLREAFDQYYPQASGLLGIGDAKMQANVEATISSNCRVIDDLARAWGDGTGRRRVSLRAWAADGYRGHSMITLGTGPDPVLTRAWLAAAVGTAAQALLALPDDDARLVGIVLDELPAVGKIDIDGLFARGRSKGVACIAGFQDIAQVRDIYGRNLADALPAMVGTQVVGQVGPGETRERLARWMGERKVAVPSISQHEQSATHSLREEMQALVEPAELSSELGVRETRRGKIIRALVHSGADVLLLEWPVRPYAARRPAHVPAAWTLPNQ